ncbi:MAG: hypothetical protein JWQ58_2378 [Reyranella sp.]|nr:hypothetical protein [Reyranella sp.]
MASSGRSVDGSVNRRPGLRGLVAAYFLVCGLIVVAAGIASGSLDGKAPQIVDSAVAASPAPSTAIDVSAPAPLPTPVALPADVPSLALPPRFRKLPPEELAGMIEITADGLRLPRISPSGWMPWIANARRFDPAGAPARLGLLVINVGINEAAMRRAIEELPPEVSLAFLPGTPDLPRWLEQARKFGHESYLMLPMDDPVVAERGIRPIDAAVDAPENLRRLRATLARGEGYVGLVIATPGRVAQSETVLRPVVKEIADRGLALIEINPTPGTASIQRLTEELGVGYARSADVLDYKLAGEGGVAGSLDRLAAWVAETAPDRVPRHAFGVVQPDEEAITAIRLWHKRQEGQPPVSFVPIIGHFECRDACMTRMRVQPQQLRP